MSVVGIPRCCLFLTLLWVSAQLQVHAESIKTQPVAFLHAITGSSNSNLSLPSDVAVDDNHIYVVDGGNHRLMVFNLKGNYQFAVGSKGSGQGQFNGPVGITVDPTGRIYVADTGNQRVQIFDTKGTYLNSLPVISGKKAIRPIDVAVDGQQHEIYVTGNNNHKVMVFTEKGQLKREWGGSGLNPGEFRYPATMTFLQDGRLAVIDILNTRLQVFDGTGEFSIEVGEWGVLAGQLFRPKGVAIDSSGNIYISDSYMNVVQVYTDTGRFMHVLKSADSSHSLETPAGIAIHGNRLYIAEMLPNRVSVFSLAP